MFKKIITTVLFIVFTFTTATPNQEVEASDISLHTEYTLHFKESIYKNNECLNKYSHAIVPNSEHGYNVYVDPNSRLENVTEKALDMWYKKTNIKFKITDNINSAQIRVYKEPLEKTIIGRTHYYNEQFNNQGFSQTAFANIYLDKDKIAQRYNNPVKVMAHEVGHTLGLDHNKDRRSIMYWSDINEAHSRIIKSDIRIAKRINREFCKIALSN